MGKVINNELSTKRAQRITFL